MNTPFSNGLDYFSFVKKTEDVCEKHSLEQIPEKGKKLPKLFDELGRVLQLADMAATCAFGCSRGDHLVEYLLARSRSYARAAIRLTQLGFYDEALTLTRSVGEISNLFALFIKVPSSGREWATATEQERRRSFSPVKVRVRLEKADFPPPTSEDRYRALSARGTHPWGPPQAHNAPGSTSTGGLFQLTGLILCLNEIAHAVSLAYGLGVLLLDHIPRDHRMEMQGAAIQLAEQLGGLDTLNVEELWRYLASENDSDNDLAHEE